MSVYRGDIIAGILIFCLITGAVVYFLSRLDRELASGQSDLFELVLPQAESVIVVNKPDEFCLMLKRQPQLDSFFRKIIPEDCLHLFRRIDNAPVLLTYYPQGVVMCYQQHDTRGGIDDYFKNEPSYPVEKDGIHFIYHPRSAKRYFGYYRHNGVCVSGYSRKLLEAVAAVHTNPDGKGRQFTDDLKGMFDKSALMNASFHSGTEMETLDLFMHEEQVCFLQDRPHSHLPDSLIHLITDCLSQKLEQQLPGLNIHSGFSRGDSVVYYTFCAPLLPKAATR